MLQCFKGSEKIKGLNSVLDPSNDLPLIKSEVIISLNPSSKEGKPVAEFSIGR
jgi:hypothetical protein